MSQFNLLSVNEFCHAVGMSRSKWHQLKRAGKAPATVMIGKSHKIRPSTAEAWLAENEIRASEDAAHKAAEGPDPIHV